MKTIFTLLINTRKGLVLLDNEFEDELWRKSYIIFGVYAIVHFLFHFLETEDTNSFLINLFGLVISIPVNILLGMVFALILHKIGQRLGGNASYIEVFSLLAYAQLPIVIGLIIVGILKYTTIITSDYNNYMLRNSILLLSYILFLKIMIQGLTKFNHYKIKIAIINIAPFIILELGLLIALIYFLI